MSHLPENFWSMPCPLMIRSSSAAISAANAAGIAKTS